MRAGFFCRTFRQWLDPRHYCRGLRLRQCLALFTDSHRAVARDYFRLIGLRIEQWSECYGQAQTDCRQPTTTHHIKQHPLPPVFIIL
ncbi:Uncharacterised protein [Shigella sonnei]|nr:Uncharacterised protein [Shigella sonnei]CSS54661.1 Uncharacterised protein [Shigella sonnei]